ncbi:MAG: hypothetical protein Kow0068_10400 [Marinilabiliales bacterium]
MKLHITIIVFLIFAGFVKAQELSSFRTKTIIVSNDTILLDSLSIYPLSLNIKDKQGNLLNKNEYKLDLKTGSLIISEKYLLKPITISYRVFPVTFNKKYFHKDINKVSDNLQNSDKPYIYKYDKEEQNAFEHSAIKRQGNISRGISFGNNQDIIVNSSFNLQLSGKINEDLNIEASITDNNIPIQPDGNTQQIQDFDKVFISLFNDNNRLTLGDFEVGKPTGYFMNLNKKVQGATYTTNINLNKNNKSYINSSISGAISKGKYNRLTFMGIEGNQGPYKLTGANNENYIIIIAGSEKIYIDGKLLKRGQEYDYVIDYNTAEVTFTSNQPITKDKRIIIEFEYSDKNYARFLLFQTNTLHTQKGDFWFNIFSENDSKNQTIQLELDDDDKRLLSQIGDSIQDALVMNIDSVQFDNDQVLYKMIDTTVNSIFYDSIFVYSTNPDSAYYRLGFSYVGENNGNYIQIQSSANGRVFKWVAPVNNIKQGNYEPVTLLVTPKKKQMINAGGNYRITKNTTAKIELSVTNNDINSFSTKDAENDIGYAIFTGLDQNIPLKDTIKNTLNMELNYQYIDVYFDPVERFRSPEFERDWNLKSNKDYGSENYLNYKILFKNKLLKTSYHFEYLDKTKEYNAYRNFFNGIYNGKGIYAKIKASYLSSEEISHSTEFIRHQATVSKKIHFINIGINEEQEINKWLNTTSDSLLGNSFSYFQWLAFIENNDTTKSKFNINYKNRKDYLPYFGQMQYATNAEELTASFYNTGNNNHRFSTSFNYRKLYIIDTLVYNDKSENNLTGRIEYNSIFFKKFITTNTYLETGAGMELKKEFNYLEVSPGQGVYKWTDYNNNNIKELDEFEVANFQDEANYIRVFTPTDNYVRTYVTQFNEAIYIRPWEIIKNKKGFGGFISRFSDNFSYRLLRKSLQDNLFMNLIPVVNSIHDSSLMSLSNSVKNQLSFNKTSPVFGIDYIIQTSQNKILLINGIDTRTLLSNSLHARVNINKYISILNSLSNGNKTFLSEFFPTKDYEISFTKNEFTIRFQPNLHVRFQLIYSYKEKINNPSIESGYFNDLGLECKYNVVEKGSFVLKTNYIKIKFNGEVNTPVGYEILEGLLPGNNATWSLIYQQNLSKSLQMNLSYNGRVSEQTKVVHVAGVQMRAYF